MSLKIQFKSNIIGRFLNGESSREIAKDEECSYNAVLRALKRNGINTSLMFWTQKEKQKFKALYPYTGIHNLLKEFPNRNEIAIQGMASKLGLQKKILKKTCKRCAREFIIRVRHSRIFCLKCVKSQWEHNNPCVAIERQKRWLHKNPNYLSEYGQRPEVKKRMAKYLKHRRKTDPKFHLDQNMGIAIYHALKDKKSGRHWELLVDYTLEELMRHLKSSFDENMSWDNYGSYWHIDHIKPRSLFQYVSSTDLDFIACWALKNLQPLEKIANLRKGNRIQE